MKLAISISGNDLDAPFDARFGRAPAYCIVDTENDEWAVHENPALQTSGGAGVQAAQFVAGLGAKAVVSGAFGPNAFEVLWAGRLSVYVAPTDRTLTGRDVLALFKLGELPRAVEATNVGHHGENRL